jgi:transcription antitermination protein NusB
MRLAWPWKWPIYLTNWLDGLIGKAMENQPLAPVNIDSSASKRIAQRKEHISKTAARAARTRAREFAIQALYQHLVGKQERGEIDEFTRNLQGFSKADSVHYDALFQGCVDTSAALDAQIEPHLDRPWPEISPIEHAIMWLGAYELKHCLDVPWRVVLNEYIEQAKAFGGTDGYKYINGILNKLAPQLRAAEAAADTASSHLRSRE